ncbi:MAG: RluA family pseudouridine synthase [Dethiobacteria bacterium]|jgi:23S rRNA pseudouridine1911/1915/1917 synthase
MEKKVHLVKSSEEGMRLDLFLSAREPALSRSFLQKLCAKGNVFISGQQQFKSGYRVRENQKVEVWIPPPEIIAAQPEDLPLEIIYEDKELLVVNKPKGMVVHPAPGHHGGTLVNALLSHCDVLFALGDRIRPGIVHRLDKDTSGLLVVAKNEPSFRVLSAQIKEREMKREYYAIVHRLPPVDEGTIDLPLGRDPNNRKKIAVRKNGTGRRAVTHFKVLDKKGPFYLLSLRLETGRTHQIRVHLSYIGSPVVGDPLYGPKRSPYNKYGQFLHARTLGFKHPRSAEYMEFTAEPGKEFSDLLKYGGKQ